MSRRVYRINRRLYLKRISFRMPLDLFLSGVRNVIVHNDPGDENDWPVVAMTHRGDAVRYLYGGCGA